ncbi:HEAT repeat domain-containing protein [Pycnococcus provasolii]
MYQSVTNSPSPSLRRTYVSSSSILETLGCETCSFTTVNTHVLLEFSRIARHHSKARVCLLDRIEHARVDAIMYKLWIIFLQNNVNSKEVVIEQLEDEMNAGSPARQEAARRLLVEMGGASAMRKISARSASVDAYRETVKEAEQSMQKMFAHTMADAQRGFHIALAMDVIVFVIGVLLIAASGVQAITKDESASWAGVGATAGGGALATMYSLLIAKPRQQVKAAVDHQMWIKMVFLGYLRELQQADQSFGRRMLEDRLMTEEELNGFKRAIQDTMTKGLIHMRQVWSKGTDLPTSETGGGLGGVHPPSAAGTRIAPIE